MAIVDEAWWTVVEYVFIMIFVALLLIIMILIQLKEIVFVSSLIPDIFETAESSKGFVSYKFPQVIEKAYSTALSIRGLRTDDRTFLEHSLYYHRTNYPEQPQFLEKVEKFMESYGGPFKISDKYEISEDEKNANIEIHIPLFYKNIISEIKVFV